MMMTNREAIEWIKAVRATDAKSNNTVGVLQRKESFNMAINALEEQEKHRWIPCSERLPEAYDIRYKPILEQPFYLVQRKSGFMEVLNYTHIYEDSWIGHAFIYEDVIAWMPLPDAYKESKE